MTVLKLFKPLILFGFVLFLSSCDSTSTTNKLGDGEPQKKPTPFVAKAPPFNSDSAYAWIEKQVLMGPRVPGSKAHANCASFITDKLKSYGMEVHVQTGPISTFDNKTFQLKNIIGSYNPKAEKRILLLAHWDSRPFADGGEIDANKPIDGADDGASGVGVLIEIARLLQQSKLTNIGVDLFFSDLEDYGQPENSTLPKMQDSWCLGTQYWAKMPHKVGYRANYGILLDMVGAKNAKFPREGTGTYFAPDIVNKVWAVGKNLGYGNYFIDDIMGNTTDDHLYVNTLAKIPCIDIVHMDPVTGTYGTHHHTHQDKLDLIDKNTLKVVGQTVLEVLYNE